MRSFQTIQGMVCTGNAEKTDFTAILAKIVNERLNKSVPAEKINDLFASSGNWLGMDKDKLMEILDAEAIKLAEQINQQSDESKEAFNYIIASVLEALNSIKNMEQLTGFLNNPIQGTDENNLLNSQLLNQSAKNIDITAEISQSLDSIKAEAAKIISDVDFSPESAKDIQQLIEKAAGDHRMDLKTAASLADTDNIARQIPIEKQKENDNIIPLRQQMSETRSSGKHLNDDVQTSILRPDVKASLNKDNNALNITDYSANSEKGTNTTIQDKTLFDFSKDQSGQDKPNSHSNNKTGINEITPIDSRQTFSAFFNKFTQDESLSLGQKVVPLDSNDIGAGKVFILNSNEKSLKLIIEPDGIGMLDIELTIEKGVINAHILASESTGKIFLDNNISNLLNNLLREGLNMGKLSVSLGGKGNDTRGDDGEDKQKTSKALQELDTLNSLNKHQLISIFV